MARKKKKAPTETYYIEPIEAGFANSDLFEFLGEDAIRKNMMTQGGVPRDMYEARSIEDVYRCNSVENARKKYRFYKKVGKSRPKPFDPQLVFAGEVEGSFHGKSLEDKLSGK